MLLACSCSPIIQCVPHTIVQMWWIDFDSFYLWYLFCVTAATGTSASTSGTSELVPLAVGTQEPDMGSGISPASNDAAGTSAIPVNTAGTTSAASQGEYTLPKVL